MDTNKLIRLVYFSTTVKSFSDEDLLTMLISFRKNNARRNISGLLVYCENCFFQIIEGEEKAINDLWDDIVKDDRHTLVTQILKCPINEKLYSDWSMAFTHYQKSSDVYVDGFKDLLNVYQAHKINPNSESKIADIVNSFSKTCDIAI